MILCYIIINFMHVCEFLVTEGQKSVSDLLGLELQMVMSYHIDTGNCAWVLWKSQALNC